MNSQDIIKDASDALQQISDRGITVMQGWYDKNIHKTHVTLWDLGEVDENFSDDDAEGVTLSLQVTIFSESDEVELAREIKKLMKEKDFSFEGRNGDDSKPEDGIYMKAQRFSKFYEIYEVDVRHRVKETTWENKETMVKTKIIPFFGERKMIDISAKDVRHWQKEMIEFRDEKGKSYSQSYLATLHAQLSAIFNHAVKFYDLKNNPAKIAGSMGSKRGGNIMFWTQEQYKAFIECVMDKPLSFYGFEMLYWCGLRIGELLALTPEDFDFEKKTVSITKNYQVVRGEKLILTPKTAKSVRTIYMPEFLNEEMEELINSMYEPDGKERIFPLSKRYFQHEMERGSEMSGVPKIRLHDLRHSHVSLLINMGFSALEIAERMGHESVRITYHYAHLFPSKQLEMINKLDEIKGELGDV